MNENLEIYNIRATTQKPLENMNLSPIAYLNQIYMEITLYFKRFF